MKDLKTIILSVSVSVIASAVILSVGLSNIARADKTVSVRGLAEREVDADLAVWPLTFSLGSNDLSELQKDILAKTEIVKNYLAEYELSGDDFTVQSPSITDNSMNPYMDKNQVRYTYIAETVVLVRSSKVEQVKKAQGDSLKLMSDGIAVSKDYKSKISFEFTKLNDIKPQMIAEATKNARTAAEQFARDSGSKVGKIKRASQGLFSIEDAAADLSERKTIRVVTTVEYLLK
ncbi:MAG: SIMPL domain-containing protein [Treponema sp.]|nr:SIMPL domain-containing protein [Treponema sp.]